MSFNFLNNLCPKLNTPDKFSAAVHVIESFATQTKTEGPVNSSLLLWLTKKKNVLHGNSVSSAQTQLSLQECNFRPACRPAVQAASSVSLHPNGLQFESLQHIYSNFLCRTVTLRALPLMCSEGEQQFDKHCAWHWTHAGWV